MLCRLCENGGCLPFRRFERLLRSHVRGFSGKVPSEWREPEGFPTGINVWNSLAKRKTPLILKNKNQLNWYMCGPTVYDSAHIGHASSYVRFDIIRRVMENYFNIDVNLLMGVTDIDDKIIYRAMRNQQTFTEVARKYEAEFFEDMQKLNILPATMTTRVSEHIPQILKFIDKLRQDDLAYITPDGSVYFDVVKYGRYGQLTSHSMDAKVRESGEKFKKHPRDFALWKGGKPGEPYWETPWGRGRPGWHIECSTMASGVFGSNFDLHSGGEDLKFPHHENEIAQSQAYHHCDQWVNYWMHTGHLHLLGDVNKMSKSIGNIVTVSDYFKNFTANQFRTFCLLTKYGNYIDYNNDIMGKSCVIYRQFINCLNMCDAYVKGQLSCEPISEVEIQTSVTEAREKIITALADDFSTAVVMDILQNLVKQLNIAFFKQSQDVREVRSPACISTARVFIESTLTKLGFDLKSRKSDSESGEEARRLDVAMTNLLKLRSSVRDFALHPPHSLFTENLDKKEKKEVMSSLLRTCDDVREDLKSVQISVKDLGKESTWQIEEK